jgi:hypothetical protein
MGIDVKKMRAKLDALQNKGGGSKTSFWSPKEGNSYSVRIVPTPDGDPFKEFWFHYELGTTGGFLCPKKNFGDICAACDFASKLYKEKNEESAKMAKKFLPRQRFFSPVVVRGEEKEGIKVWGYGKNAYQDLINLVLNPDYGDITDPEQGTDLALSTSKAPGQSFPMTKITPARKTSKLCQGTGDECKALLETLPDFDKLHTRKASEEVATILDEYLAGDHSEEETEKDSRETVKFGAKPAARPVAKPASKNAVDEAFDELLNS